VRFDDLISISLYELLPELKDDTYRRGLQVHHLQFGEPYRAQIFKGKPQPVLDWQINLAAEIAFLIGDLFLPIFTALLCHRPRPWLKKPYQIDPDLWQQLQGHITSVGELPRLKDIQGESWLHIGRVDTDRKADGTKDLPDVRQWITLLRELSSEPDILPA